MNPAPQSSFAPVASVVIPTRNRPRAVVGCLDALAVQTLPAGAFEAVVVDDGSEPPLALDAARWAAKFQLRVLHQPNTGPAGARNRGVAAAHGEFIAFTDDDCRPTPAWLETLVATLRADTDILVGGSTFNGLEDDLFAAASQLILDLVYSHFNRDPEQAFFFASNNLACARADCLALGAFDEDFATPAGEDRDFCDRWRCSGRRLVWRPAARVEHRHPLNLRSFLALYYRYGRGARLYARRRRGRRSGSMREDVTFHAFLPVRLMRHLGHTPSLRRRVGLCAALLAWELANAAGFLAATWGNRGASAPTTKPTVAPRKYSQCNGIDAPAKPQPPLRARKP